MITMMLMMTLKQMSRDTGTNVVLVNNTDVLYKVVLESSNEALEHGDIDEMLDIVLNFRLSLQHYSLSILLLTFSMISLAMSMTTRQIKM